MCLVQVIPTLIWIIFIIIMDAELAPIERDAESAPIESENVDTDVTFEAMQYMTMNGYLDLPDPRLGNLLDEKTIQESLESLQRFAGLPVTGVLDKPTAELIVTPRCGLPDISKSHDTRKRKYAFHGTKWEKTGLTWKLKNDNNDNLSRNQVEETLEKAFSRWEAVSSLNFRKIEINSSEQPDIEVKFGMAYHGDAYPFDGPGKVLGHGIYPLNNEGNGGDLHFDDAEVYTVGTPKGISLLWVATHEIGHSLGLEHTNIKKSVMLPWYSGYAGENFPLSEDDIFGIQSIYGPKQQPGTKESVKPKIEFKNADTRIPCSMKGAVYDKVTDLIYVFNGENLYKIDQTTKRAAGPINVGQTLNVVQSVDSAYVNSKSQVVFFKGTSYYIFQSLSELVFLEKGSIFDKFVGLNSNTTKIDAAFRWQGNGKTYLFTGNLFYRFNDYSNVVYHDYPREIKEFWDDIPTPLDSIFSWKNGATYVFKDIKFYRINNKAEVENYYPKSISSSWMECVS